MMLQEVSPFSQFSVKNVHVANRDGHMDNFRGCRVNILNKTNSKLDGKIELMLTSVT
jgi:hypothetical protein